MRLRVTSDLAQIAAGPTFGTAKALMVGQLAVIITKHDTRLLVDDLLPVGNSTAHFGLQRHAGTYHGYEPIRDRMMDTQQQTRHLGGPSVHSHLRRWLRRTAASPREPTALGVC